MSEIEILTAQIGEFVFTEVDDVNRVDYTKEGAMTAFTIVMENGKRYALNLQEQKIA